MARRFNTHPIHIESLLGDIDDGNLALPEFQRDFVWEPAASAELLVSLLQDFPAGSLLIWTPQEESIRMRAFSGAPPLYKANPKLALDGQQRLTSIFQAFYGKGEHRYFLDLTKLRGDVGFPDGAVMVRTVESVAKDHLDSTDMQFQRLLFPVERLRSGFEGYLNLVSRAAHEWLARLRPNH